VLETQVLVLEYYCKYQVQNRKSEQSSLIVLSTLKYNYVISEFSDHKSAVELHQNCFAAIVIFTWSDVQLHVRHVVMTLMLLKLCWSNCVTKCSFCDERLFSSVGDGPMIGPVNLLHGNFCNVNIQQEVLGLPEFILIKYISIKCSF